MKLLFIFIQFLIVLSSNTDAQQLMLTVEEAENDCEKLVQTPADVYKIEQQKNLFIGKPLKVLLEEIQPPIKRVIAQPSVNVQSYAGNFCFNFIDNDTKDSLIRVGQMPVTLTVLVKEHFDWDFQKRPKGRELIWTAEDAKKYEHLTVIGFRIYGGGVIAY